MYAPPRTAATIFWRGIVILDLPGRLLQGGNVSEGGKIKMSELLSRCVIWAQTKCSWGA